MDQAKETVKARALTPLALAWATLRRRPARSGSLCLLVALFAFALCAAALVNAWLKSGLSGLSGRMGADILIVPYGYEKKLEGALLRGEPSQFYTKVELVDKIRGHAFVAAASPQLFLTSLSAGCCSVKVQLVGFDPATDFSVGPWLRSRLDKPLGQLGTDEIVVGALITAKPGESIRFFGKPFTVAARMDRSGMGFDSSVFMTLEAARLLTKEALFAELAAEGLMPLGGADDADAAISSVLIKVKDGSSVKEAANELMRLYAIPYNLDMLVAADMLSAISSSIKNLSLLLFGLACGLWGIALLALFVVFSAGQAERRREMAILRLLGATRKRLALITLTEALLISLAGAAGGLGAAGLLLLPFAPLLFQTLGLPYLPLSCGQALAVGITVALLALLTGPLAASWSALSLTRLDTYQSLREGE